MSEPYEYKIAGVGGCYTFGWNHGRLTREQAEEALAENLRMNERDGKRGMRGQKETREFAEAIHIERRRVSAWHRFLSAPVSHPTPERRI